MTLRNGFTLGSWTIYPLEGRLVGDGEERRIQPKSMDVLLCLADAAGEVVEREYLLQQVWGERAPSDEPLTRCIGDLRRALGDSRSEPEFIHTVPKRGYQLLKPATEIDRERIADERSAVTAEPQAAQWISNGIKITAAFLVVLAAVLLFNGIERPVGNTKPVSADNALSGALSNIGQDPSIVVLPFVNMSSDSEQEYFSDGIAEELLNLLARFPDLRVISRSSAFSYKGRNTNVRTVAEELNVTHVLEGSVRRSGDQVRITAQLIDAGSDTNLWSETYERTLGDIFATQDEIAAMVVEQLKIRLLGDRPTARENNTEAFALFLQARYVGRQFTPESFETSIALLKQTLALDPEYASAWDELGRIYRRQAGQGLRPIDESYALARNATHRALALDPTLASAHRSLAVIARNYDRDLSAAAGHIQRAHNLDPANTDTISNAAAMAGALGRLEQAIALQEYAVARDPVNPVINTFLGTLYLHAGRLDDAIAAFRTTLILNPVYLGMHFLIGEGLLLKGETQAALEAMQSEPDEGYRLIGLAMAFHAMGDAAASEATLAELISKYEQDAPYNISYTLAFRGEADQAFSWLDKAVAYNDPGLTDILTDPLFATVHADPRWLPFLASIGKSPEQLATIEFNPATPE